MDTYYYIRCESKSDVIEATEVLSNFFGCESVDLNAFIPCVVLYSVRHKCIAWAYTPSKSLQIHDIDFYEYLNENLNKLRGD